MFRVCSPCLFLPSSLVPSHLEIEFTQTSAKLSVLVEPLDEQWHVLDGFLHTPEQMEMFSVMFLVRNLCTRTCTSGWRRFVFQGGDDAGKHPEEERLEVRTSSRDAFRFQDVLVVVDLCSDGTAVCFHLLDSNKHLMNSNYHKICRRSPQENCHSSAPCRRAGDTTFCLTQTMMMMMKRSYF